MTGRILRGAAIAATVILVSAMIACAVAAAIGALA